MLSSNDATSVYRPGGRIPKREAISDAEARRRAEQYLRYPPSSQLLKTFEALATAGVLVSGHLAALADVAPRTLCKYAQLHLVDRLPVAPSHLQALGLDRPAERLRVYCLGAVGLAMAEHLCRLVPTGYHAQVDRITHDLLAAEVVARWALTVAGLGYDWEWRSRYEATLRQGKVPFLEPDAMFVVRNRETGERRVWLLEFHNEDSGRRVEEKVKRYVEASFTVGPKVNVEPWLGVRHPTVIAICTHRAPHNAYFRHFQRGSDDYAPQTGWYGATWAEFVRGHPLNLLDYRANKWGLLLEGAGKSGGATEGNGGGA